MTKANGPNRAPWLGLVAVVVLLALVGGIVAWRGRDMASAVAAAVLVSVERT